MKNRPQAYSGKPYIVYNQISNDKIKMLKTKCNAIKFKGAHNMITAKKKTNTLTAYTWDD